tara:strand:+ start:123271 stop:123522 length:252 start_codon:yes stop_codon:yes gene_type:complete
VSEETKEQTSEAENTQVKETISDSTGDVNEEMSSDNEHKVLPYPDRVPNVHKGTTYKHCYIMITFIGVFIILSILASLITNPL